MKKIQFFRLFLSVIVIFSLLAMPKHASGANMAVTQGCHSVDATMTLSDEKKLTETAQAIVLYELNSDTMLYTWNPDAKIYPTSMVKMMTTLVALENASLDEMVTVTRKVLDQVAIGSVSAGLKVGEEISVQDLLYCTMVASANDATTVVANYVGGSAENFVQMMNDKAAALGCTGTQYSNVHGLHDENTYTTARDICRITEAALENETFREMFQTAVYTVAPTNKSDERIVKTTNYMMLESNKKYYNPLVTGGKTGATDKGGRCLTMTAEKNGMEILCVLMGAVPTVEENGSLSAFGSFEESKVIMDYAFANFEYRQVFFDGQSLAQYPVEGGSGDVVTQATSTISTVLPIEVDESLLKWNYLPDSSTISAPVVKGQKLGSVEAWYGTKCLAQTDMVAMHDVRIYQAPTIPEKPEGKSDGNWLTFFLVLLGVAVVAFLGVLGLRTIRIINYRRRVKRRRSRRNERMGTAGRNQ